MATILIVDDRPINRQFLQTLLGYGGHRLIDAADGAEALNHVRTERPDLVITDILMPRMDGFEFTQQLRAEPELAGTKVIFYTATYSVPDADKLAKACGVSVVLPKPSEPAVILNAVNEALALQPAPEPPAVAPPGIPPDLDETAALDRIGAHISAHLSSLQATQPMHTGARPRPGREQPNEATAKFVTHVAQLETLTARLCALLELRSALLMQRDPFKMHETFCRGARSIVNAERMMLAVMDDTGRTPRYGVSTGIGSTAVLRHDLVTAQAVKAIEYFAGRGPLRVSGTEVQTLAGDLPGCGADTRCLLSVPVISDSTCYGLLWFINREGSTSFSTEDEEFSVMLAAELALLQENLGLYLMVQQHATNMQLEIVKRKEAEQAIRRINRVHAVLSGINNLIIRAHSGPQLFRDACRIAVEQGGFGMSWIGTFDAARQEITPVAWAGIDDGNYSMHASSTTREELPTGQSLVARAVRSRVPVFDNDIAANPQTGGVHRQEAIRLGYRSAIALPLLLDNEVVGTLTLLAKEAGFFNADEVKLLTGLSDDISFALKFIRVQQELVDEQHLLHNLMDNVPDAIYFKDREHRFVRLNRVQAQRLNIGNPENGIGKTIKGFVSQDQATRIEAEDNKIFSSGRPVIDRIVPMRLSNGRDAWTSTTKAPIRDRAGRISGLVGISRDITERMLAIRDMERKAQLALLLEALARAGNEAVTPEDALQQCVAHICNHGGWVLGHVCAYKQGDGRTPNISIWHNPQQERFAEFIRETAAHQYGTGAGKFLSPAIRDRKPVWVQDFTAMPGLKRMRKATEYGIRSGFVFPVVGSRQVLAFLEFFGDEVREPDTLLLDSIGNVGSQLARVIERQQAIDRLRESEQKLENILGTLQEVVWSMDPVSGRLVYVNPAIRQLTRRPVSDFHVQPRLWRQLIHRDDRASVRDSIRRLLQEGKMIQEFRIVLGDDEERFVETRARIWRSNDGNASYIDGTVVDITERKRAEIALHQLNLELEIKIAARTEALNRARLEADEANRAKSEFLAAMSHEIRTPMNGVIGMIDVLHQTSLRGDQVEMVSLIRESAFSLLGVINDILDFSKIEAGKLELEKVPMAVQDVVEGVGGMLDRLAQNSDVELTMFTDPAIPPEVAGDALRLRQILINLASNAIKFSANEARRGRVSMRAVLVRRDPEMVSVEFQVADNGIGMSEQTQAQLFKAFSQADASTTRRFGGTGLGLVITNHLVELMGGEITVQSAPGAGSTFKARVPFALLPGGAIPAEKDPEIEGLSLVVVGKSGGFSDDLAAYLTHARVQVERAPDLENAMKRPVSRGESTVWVVDTRDEIRSPEQLRAIVSTARPNVTLVVVTTERKQQPSQQMLAPGLFIISGNALNRQTFLRAVAVAAGRASIESEAERGPAFKSATSAPSREEARRQGKLILVAEDNETNQKVILRQLTLLGYAADIAADGQEALGLWRSGDYALVLTDLQMPHADGYDLTKAIRGEEKDGKRIPIIALSANAMKEEADACRAVGMNDFLSKPSPLATLRAMLEKWLPLTSSAGGIL